MFIHYCMRSNRKLNLNRMLSLNILNFRENKTSKNFHRQLTCLFKLCLCSTKRTSHIVDTFSSKMITSSQRFCLVFALIFLLFKENSGQYGYERRLPYPISATAYNNQNNNGQGYNNQNNNGQGYNNQNNNNGQGHCCNCSGIPPHTHPQLLLTTTTSPPPPPPPQSINSPFSPISQQIPNYLRPSFSDDRSAVNSFPRESILNTNNLIPNGNSNGNIINPNVNINMNQIPITTDGNIEGANLDNVIHFNLFTRETPVHSEVLKVNNQQMLNASKFLVSRPTKIILHGFADGSDEKIGDWVSAMRKAFLSASDSNVIVVDYSYFSGYLFFWTNLPLFAASKLADMVYFLERNGARMENFHVVGRSWGSHIAGMAGRMCKGKLGRISGLEPAGPSTNLVGHEHLLDFTDAQLVDIVHVNGKRFFFHGARFGLVTPTGHVDIYPNFAEKSSGCPDESSNFRSFSFRSCKRGRGVKYFVDTIEYPFAHPICLCPSFQMYKSGECHCGQQNTITMGQINNQTIGVFQLAAAPLNALQRNLWMNSRRFNSPMWG